MLGALKNGAVVCNIGHFDTEIDTAFMRKNWHCGRSEAAGAQGLPHLAPGSNVNPSSPNYLMLLSEGRLVNLGNATGHPSRIMDGSFANQVLAQMYLYEQKFATHFRRRESAHAEGGSAAEKAR
jgi:adenosylhomocysteinase